MVLCRFSGLLRAGGPEGLWRRGQPKRIAKPFFSLQFRAVEGGSEQKVSVPPNVAMSLVTDLGVQFCPWCGEKLTKFYRSRINDLYRPDLAIEVV